MLQLAWRYFILSMKRVTYSGHTFNQRTVDMIKRLEFNLLEHLGIYQGSYNTTVGNSAGTHDGGGAVDFIPTADNSRLITEGRKVGFAIWHRTPAQGPWVEHDHGIALGDPEAAPLARTQMAAYRSGRNGLANNGPDDGPRVGIYVWPHVPKKTVNLFVVWRQFKFKNPTPHPSVARVQWILNEKLNLHISTDGVAGPQTREAYKRWQRATKAKHNDGIPRRGSLVALGRGWFNVGIVAWEKHLKVATKNKK